MFDWKEAVMQGAHVGTKLAPDVARAIVKDRIDTGYFQRLEFDDCVFLCHCEKGKPTVQIHIVSQGGLTIERGREFMAKLFDLTETDFILVVQKNRRMKRFAIRFGWRESGLTHDGYPVLRADKNV